MTPEELDELQTKINSQKVQNHLDAEAKRIKEISCPVCDTNLKLKPADYLKMGNKPEKLECKKCERFVTVYINYKEDPETSDADITVKSGGYPWATELPSTWEDKHVKRWIEEEEEKIKNNTSGLSVEGQKLFRMNLLALKKAKIIK